jgi:hypothetical protein
LRLHGRGSPLAPLGLPRPRFIGGPEDTEDDDDEASAADAGRRAEEADGGGAEEEAGGFGEEGDGLAEGRVSVVICGSMVVGSSAAEEDTDKDVDAGEEGVSREPFSPLVR